MPLTIEVYRNLIYAAADVTRWPDDRGTQFEFFAAMSDAFGLGEVDARMHAVQHHLEHETERRPELLDDALGRGVLLLLSAFAAADQAKGFTRGALVKAMTHLIMALQHESGMDPGDFLRGIDAEAYVRANELLTKGAPEDVQIH